MTKFAQVKTSKADFHWDILGFIFGMRLELRELRMGDPL